MMSQKPEKDFAQSEIILPQHERITQTAVLVLDGSNTLSLAAAVDPMRAANRQAGRTLFDWDFVTPGAADVRLTSGLRVPANPLHRTAPVDLLLVVAGFDLEAQATPALCAGIRRLAARAETVAGIDGGPWIMARAGILRQHRATTHWEDLETFAQTFPETVTVNARFVESGDRLTSGGAAPAIDMMLRLIGRRHGTALAEKIAGSFIYDIGSLPPGPQHRRGGLRDMSGITARAQDLMEAHLEDPLTLQEIARRLGLSLRALQMHFRKGPGVSPRAHYLALRLAEAERLVCRTHRPLHDVALATGFNSQSSFARAYTARFGLSARRHRARGGLAQ